MTSYTRKLYKTAPSAAVALHRRKPGRLLAFFAGDTATEIAAYSLPSEGGKVSNNIAEDFEVNERLTRWADRGWR